MSAYDTSSEIFSLYAHSPSRGASTATTPDSEPLPTPPDDVFCTRQSNARDPNPRAVLGPRGITHKPKQHTAQPSVVSLEEHSWSDEPLGVIREGLEDDVDEREPYGPYFSLPPDPTAPSNPLVRRGTAKELIGRYQSMEDEVRPSRTSTPVNDAKSTRRHQIPRGGAISDKDRKRSPIRQSIRNFLSVFKNKKINSREPSGDRLAVPGAAIAVSALSLGNAPSSQHARLDVSSNLAQCTTPISPRNTGCLLYLSRPATPGLYPVWTPCTIALHTSHILVMSTSAQGHPSTEMISFVKCMDVRSMSLNDLGQDERSLLPSGPDTSEVRVFELVFEGKPSEMFAAKSVKERAKWVSAVWDSILECQERKSLAPSVAEHRGSLDTISEPSAPENRLPGSYITDDDLSTTTERLSVFARTPISDVERSPTPRTPRSRAMSPGSTPLTGSREACPRTPSPSSIIPHHTRVISTASAPTTPTRALRPSDPPRSQSPSIQNLGRRSVVKERLAKFEHDISELESPVSVRSSIGQLPTPVRPILASRERGTGPSAGIPRLRESPAPSPVCIVRSPATNSAPPASSVEIETASPLSLFSGRLAAVAASTPVEARVARWAESADRSCRGTTSHTRIAADVSEDALHERPKLTIMTEQSSTIPSNAEPNNARDTSERYPQRTYIEAVKVTRNPFSREPELKKDVREQRSYTDAAAMAGRHSHGDVLRSLPPIPQELVEPTEYEELQESRIYTLPTKELVSADTARSDSEHVIEQPVPQDATKGIGYKIFESIGLMRGWPEAGDTETHVTSTNNGSLKYEDHVVSDSSASGSNTPVNDERLPEVMDKLNGLQSEFRSMKVNVPAVQHKDSRASGTSAETRSHDWSALHDKIDGLAAMYQTLQKRSAGEGKREVQAIVSLLKDAQIQRAASMEQQADSVRYLNELNTWLEVFVQHGSSQIETVADGVRQLCKEIGLAPGETTTGNLASDVRRLLDEQNVRAADTASLQSSINGLAAMVREDLRRNAEVHGGLTLESIAGMVDRQRQDQEYMLRAVAAELSDDIRGERLRFVEAMKEATAINIQNHVEEFKRELNREVMQMTQEVSNLQRERQSIEHKIADLFAFYAQQKQSGKELHEPASVRFANRVNGSQRSRVPATLHNGPPVTTRRRPLPSPMAPRPMSYSG